MPKFRRKPVAVEARRMPTNDDAFRNSNQYVKDCESLAAWCGGTANVMSNDVEIPDYIQVRTPEGMKCASPGDWIIKNGSGEFWPCRHDVFVKNYDADAGEMMQERAA